MKKLIILALFPLIINGCDQRSTESNSTTPSGTNTADKYFLQEPSQPTLCELPTEALAEWRLQEDRKPALVIFSSNPMLLPIPDEAKTKAIDLARNGTQQELRALGSFFAPSPLILPTQTSSAALELGLFSEIFWVYPGQGEIENIDHVAMRDSLANQMFVTPEESGSFSNNQGVVSGKVRGIPLHLVHPDAIPALTRPLVIHIDLSFFTTLYRNEEGTPAYDLILDFAKLLRNKNLDVLSTTLSYSNIEGNVPVDLRFMLTDLYRIMQQPKIIDSPLPETWNLRAKGMAQTTLLQHSEAFDFYRRAQELAPNDASTQFDLYLSFSALKKPEQALAALERTVELDPGYFFEYLNAASRIVPEGGLVEGLALMEKAIEVMDNPGFVLLQCAQTQLDAGHPEQAQITIDRVKALPWSPIYHQDIIDYLPQLEDRLQRNSN